MLGTVHSDLADNLTTIGHYDDAQKAYEDGLEISREVGDQRSVGAILGNWGALALARGDRAAARDRYTEALHTFQRLGEPQMEAVGWHQLGMVAQEGRDWAEAERCYRESLRIKEAQRDWPGVSRTCNQLALVAKGDGRFDDAERWYLRAIDVNEQIGQQREMAATCNNLANLYLDQNRLGEAEAYARRALAIKETLDVSAEPWTTYAILAEIAAAQGDSAAARDWRRKEQESFAAYAGARHEITQYGGLISAVVEAASGNEQAQEFVENEYPKMAVGGEQWQEAARSIRQILEGARDVETLTEKITSRTIALIVRVILQQLAGDPPPPTQVRETSEAVDQPPAEPTEAAGDPLTRLRQTWAPIVAAVVAAANGNSQAASELEPVLEELASKDDWQALAAVLRRILDGERDVALLDGLDQTDTIIAGNVLRDLDVAHPALEPLPSLESESTSQDEAQSLDEFLNTLLGGVVVAARGEGPPDLGVQLHATTHGLATAPDMPPELQALGRILNAILSGDRDPDLSALPPQLVAAVQQVLARIAED